MKHLLVLLAAVLFASCSGRIERNEFFPVLEKRLADGAEARLVLSEVFDFDWEKVYFFPPYTPIDKINNTIGSKEVETRGIERRDDICLLVFVGAEEQLRSFGLPRSLCDFSAISTESGLTPNAAVFDVRCQDSYCKAQDVAKTD